MSTLYLHIGMPKTGTTYIQNFLRKNKPLMMSKGYVFPNFGMKFEGIGVNRNAHFMVCRIRDEKGNLDVQAQKQIFSDCFNRIGELFQTYENVILTDETLWNSAERLYFNENLWADLKKKSQEMNFDLKIIVYLRRQDLFVQSYWAQQVKETYTRSFETFLKGKIYKTLKLDYYSRLTEIAKYIGKENILVRVYEKSQYQGTDNTLVSDFLHTIGLELTDEYKPLEKESLNISLSGVYLETKRIMNSFEEFKVKKSYFSNYLRRVAEENNDATKFDANICFPDPQHLKEYMDSFAESNSKVAKEFLGRTDGILFHEMPDISKIQDKVKYKDKDIYNILGEIIKLQNRDIEELKAELLQTKTETGEEIKQLQATVNWITTPLPKKVTRKLRRVFKIK